MGPGMDHGLGGGPGVRTEGVQLSIGTYPSLSFTKNEIQNRKIENKIIKTYRIWMTICKCFSLGVAPGRGLLRTP